MLVIIEVGSKQILVKEGDTIFLEKIEGEEGNTLVFDKVLLFGEKIGTPYLEGVKVEAIIQKQGRQKKLVVYRHNPKSTHKRKLGHRQPYTRVLISKITTS